MSAVLIMAPLTYKLTYFNDSRVSFCSEASVQDRLRGSYENKIRFFSTPEKIYETFATSKDENGKLTMSYSDFFKALTPYNFTEMKDNKPYFKVYSPDILKIADADGNGDISFAEFFFFVTIL